MMNKEGWREKNARISLVLKRRKAHLTIREIGEEGKIVGRKQKEKNEKGGERWTKLYESQTLLL